MVCSVSNFAPRHKELIPTEEAGQRIICILEYRLPLVVYAVLWFRRRLGMMYGNAYYSPETRADKSYEKRYKCHNYITILLGHRERRSEDLVLGPVGPDAQEDTWVGVYTEYRRHVGSARNSMKFLDLLRSSKRGRA